MIKDEALRLALKALEGFIPYLPLKDKTQCICYDKAIIAIKEALETKDEPVAWMVWGHDNVPSLTFTKPADKYVFDSLYMTPPQRTWVGLTDEDEIDWEEGGTLKDLVKAIEAKLKEKNT